MSAGVRICAVIVTYHPSLAALGRAIQCIAGQIDGILVIDNASEPPVPRDLLVAERDGLRRLIRLPGNRGLAGAQNYGISLAQEHGYSHVLLLDQDSFPAPDMVSKLVHAEQTLIGLGKPVAVVGPQFRDSDTGRVYPFCRLKGPFVRKIYDRAHCDGEEYCEAFFVIASGSLIRIDVLRSVGSMEEGLFIDNVDLEWCFRAASKGYQCFGVFSARLEHRIGERYVELMGGRFVQHIHPPSRLFYITRNRLLLYCRPYVPLAWKLADALRFLAKFFQFSLFVRPRAENCRQMVAGVRAALVTLCRSSTD